MKQYISESRAVYEDMYHGMFSEKLAKWAISRMEMKDPATKQLRPLTPRPLENVTEVLKQNGINLPEEFIYTAWYLFNMALADYPVTLTTDVLRAHFVEETLCDPDGCPESVLACFEAKMCLDGTPIYWERML